MKRTATTKSWSKLLFIAVAALTLCVTMGATQASAQISTTNNNFTMLDPAGGMVGGTNDVAYTWDGTMKSSVASSGQASNATLSSGCTFFGQNWTAHDLAIYGPGTYTVYDACVAGAPGCATGNPVAFTVGATELAAHMLFDWGGSFDIDVIDVWSPAAVFAPSPMWTTACGANPGGTTWDWMSKDWNLSGINGAGMTDGPFMGFHANFNVMSPPCVTNCSDADPCTDDACNTATGVCEYSFNTASCSDNDACTTGDACSGGTCLPGTAVDCDDNNVCTNDSCDTATGCVNANNTDPCDDTLFCTLTDVCSGGSCLGSGPTCTTPPNLTCDEAGDVCVACTFLADPLCNDNNVCTDDSCNTITGACINANNTAPCDDADGNICTTGLCGGGACAPANNTAACDDNDTCTSSDVCSGGTCGGTPVDCDDADDCTTDTCNSATGCVNTAIPGCDPGGGCIGPDYENLPVDTLGNNFTMIDGTGALVGGTNDVRFTWDGTKKTAVAASSQVPNATITSSCPFFGSTWSAHDVTVYAPGTYTIYDGCAIGSPGCGTGNAVTFTVAEGELGAHMLFDWTTSSNIDVVDVWSSKMVFGPSEMWAAACGSNEVSKVWDWMSKDFDGDGTNGKGMTDGPFMGFNANFSVMGTDPTVDTLGNNFTMIDGTGALVGGTNDVRFTWAGSTKTKVCDLDGGQVPNATITSSCPFFGSTWSAHDVTVYAPGTYTIYDGCAANDPDCGTGNAVTFTVAEGELGAHMLFDWTTSSNIDVVDVWAPTTVFGPSEMWATDCGANEVTRVWDWMSKDFDGDGTNGKGMTDGPFMGFNANFSVMGVSSVNLKPLPFDLTAPGTGAAGLGTTVEFRWKKTTDPDVGDSITYSITYCTDANLTGCTPITVATQASAKAGNTGIFFAGGAGVLLIGMTFIGGISSRKRIVLLLLLAISITGGSIMACSNTETSSDTNLPIDEMSYTAEGLTPATTYYWKVAASDGKAGGTTSSEVRSFTTQ